MNKKLKTTLKNYSSEQGFALPIAIGMGLIMILIATTLVMRSQGDQVTASAQKATAGSLAVAETGITRIQALLKKYPLLATKNATTWNTTTDTTITTCSGATATTGSNETTEEATLITRNNSAQWINVNDADPNLGEFRVVSYNYLPNTPTAGFGTGTLNIEGRAKSQNAAATATSSTVNTLGNSTSSLVVQLPFIPSASPGIWVKGALSPLSLSTDNSVQANVVVVGCSYGSNPSPSSTPTNKFRSFADGTRPTAEAKPATFPPLPDLPTTGPASLLGAATPSGPYFLPSLNIPSGCYIVLPRITRGTGASPSAARAASATTVTGFGRQSATATASARSCTATNAPSSNGNPSAGLSSRANLPLGGTFDITTDMPGADGVYRYLIDSDSSPTGVSLSLSDSRLVIDPPTGTKVVLYLRGNMNLMGGATGTTTVACTPYSGVSPLAVRVYANGGAPQNLEIYGANGSKYGGSFLTNTIGVSTKAAIHGFIYAPEATVNVTQSEIRGVVWANTIATTNNSSGCGVGVAQESVGSLSVSANQRIDPIQSWQRQQAN